MVQWLFVAFVNTHELVAATVPLSLAPRDSVFLPAALDRQPVTRSTSRRLLANVAALAERCPRAIIRVTSADVVTRPSRPTVRTMIAMMTSTMVNPRSVFISTHHLADRVDEDRIPRSRRSREPHDALRVGQAQAPRVELHRVEGLGHVHAVQLLDLLHHGHGVDC